MAKEWYIVMIFLAIIFIHILMILLKPSISNSCMDILYLNKNHYAQVLPFQMPLYISHIRNTTLEYMIPRSIPSVNSLRYMYIYICINNLTNIGSDNGLSPGRCQAIIWTNNGILLIGPLRKIFSEISITNFNIFIQENAFESVVFEMVTILSRPQYVKVMFLFSPWPCAMAVYLYNHK